MRKKDEATIKNWENIKNKTNIDIIKEVMKAICPYC